MQAWDMEPGARVGTRGAVDRPEVADQGRALGDRTRYAIFDQLRRAETPVGVAELTNRFGLHHNAVRQHLAKLRDAGLVVEEKVPRRTPGRPALQYRLSPGAIEQWAATSPHEELSLMLLDLLSSGHTPRQVGLEAGERLAGELSGPTSDPVEVLLGVTRRLGFEPHRTVPPFDADPGSPGGACELVLEHCPFAAGAQLAPHVVCELHRGLAEGVCIATGGLVRVDDLVLHAPHQGGCRLRLSISPVD